MQVWNAKLKCIFCKCKFEMQCLKLKFEMKIWNANLKCKVEMQIWNANLICKFEMQIWNASLKCNFEMQLWLTCEFWNTLWKCNFEMQTEQAWEIFGNANLKCKLNELSKFLRHFWATKGNQGRTRGNQDPSGGGNRPGRASWTHSSN